MRLRWWHRIIGTEYSKEQAVGAHREASRPLIHKLFERGPLLGLTRIEHEFNDYHVSTHHPVGTWRVTVERIAPPPEGKVSSFKRKAS